VSRTGRAAGQRGLWARDQTMSRAELDAWRPDVGDRVWCGGQPFIVEYRNEDGSVGLAYEPKESPAAQQNGTPR